MAVTYGFFNSVNNDRRYDADQMSEYFEGLISDGVYESVGSAMQVLASSGMNVQVGTGRIIINSKWMKNDAVLTLGITASHATMARYTAIIARIDYRNRLMEIVAKDGTPAASPAFPEIVNNGQYAEKCLAYIYVGAGATQISQSNITDTRADNTVCGWVTGLVEQVDTATLFLQWQTAYENYYNSMTSASEHWFSDLTEELRVDTYIKEYTKTATLTSSSSGYINLDMTGYEYEASDIVLVTINGLMARQGEDFTIITSGTTTPQIRITMTDKEDEDITIRILKSKIGTTS